MANVDISQLAIDRTETNRQLVVRRNLVTRYLIPGIILLGFFALILWAAWDYVVPPQKVKVVPVIASKAEARLEGTPLFNAAGWIEPRPTAIRVAALAEGVVEELLVVEDQVVKKGEPVAELVKEDAQLAYDRSQADRKLAEAELSKALAAKAAAITRYEQPVHLEAELAKSEALLAKVRTMLNNLKFETDRAKSKLDLAQKNHKRNQDAGDSVSQRELDETFTVLETAEALVTELNERRDNLLIEEKALSAQREAMNTQLQLLADELQAKDEATALVEAAKAKVAQRTVAEAEAELRLSRMTIKAPEDGRIYQLVGLPGSRVGAGVMTAMETHDGSSVVTMYKPTSLQIRVDVRFEDIPKVSLQQKVLINNPALEEPIPGKVLFISSEADIQKNTLQVKVSIDEPPGFFKPEMLVDVTFLAPPVKKTNNESNLETRIFVDKRFVQNSEEGSFVWVADRSEGMARKAMVTTGSANGPIVEITSGLSMDTRLISTGIETLRDGSRIKVIGEDSVGE